MKDVVIWGFIFFVIAFYVILNKLKELANEPTTVTKIIKKGDNFCLLQLHINKKRKFLKIERWVEVGTLSNYEQIKRLQKTIEQTWNKSND